MPVTSVESGIVLGPQHCAQRDLNDSLGRPLLITALQITNFRKFPAFSLLLRKGNIFSWPK